MNKLREIVETGPSDEANIILVEGDKMVVACFDDRVLSQVAYFDTQFEYILSRYMEKIQDVAPDYTTLYEHQAPEQSKWIVKELVSMMQESKKLEHLPIDYVTQYQPPSQTMLAELLASAVYTMLGRKARFFPKKNTLILHGNMMTENLKSKIYGAGEQFEVVHIV